MSKNPPKKREKIAMKSIGGGKINVRWWNEGNKL